MTPQEQELIAQLFARLKQTPAQPTDTEAADLIRRLVAEQPDAPYKLVQTVLIQDMALTQAQARIAELERQLGDTGLSQRGSFLPQSAPRSSVPGVSPWQRSAPQAVEVQPAPTRAGGSQPPMQPPFASAAPLGGGMAGASSGFLRAAAATALGVAGGQLLFQGVESMFGQHAGSMLAGQPLQPSLTENVVNNFYSDPGSANPEEAADPTMADSDPGADPGIDDASDPDVASNDDLGDDSDPV
jgi:hypothetical protein